MTKQQRDIEISYTPDEAPRDEKEKKKHSLSKRTSPPKKPGIKTLQQKIKEQEEILETTVTERDELKDKLLRHLAEMDNFRKRVIKEKEEYQKYVLSEFLLELLQIYDNLERALKAKTPAEKESSVLNLLVSEDEKSIVSGVEMIYKQFTDLLRKYNVVGIDALNKPFDPNLHQALSKEETEGIEEPMIIEVYQKGFLYNGKLLKPTLAKVAIPKKEEEEEDEDDWDDEETDEDEE